jgi:hypothetical protein
MTPLTPPTADIEADLDLRRCGPDPDINKTNCKSQAHLLARTAASYDYLEMDIYTLGRRNLVMSESAELLQGP